MALVLYATRIAGSELMSLVPMTPRLEAALKSMATSVLLAIVVSEILRGGFREGAAVAAAIAAMLVFRHPMLAMIAGMVTAGIISHLPM